MILDTEKQNVLQSSSRRPLYRIVLLCGRYLRNRAVSVSKRIKLTNSHSSSAAATTISATPYSATAYLSGLRGLASVSVYIFHATWAYSSVVDRGYGFSGVAENYHLIQLPFVRLIHAGHAMVALFFLIGGYVNAVKPLRLMRAGPSRRAELSAAVASSLLRRPIRLYLPAATAMLCTALLAWAGLFEPARRLVDAEPRLYFFYPDFHPARFPTLAETFADLSSHLCRLFFYGPFPHWQSYDPHLWTVALELRASLVLAIALAAVACCTVPVRFCIMAALTTLAFRCNHWEMGLFFAGAILAELDLIRQQKASSGSPPPEAARRLLDSSDEDEADADFDTERRVQRMLGSDSDLESAPLHPFHASISASPYTSMAKRIATAVSVIFGLYLLSAPTESTGEVPGYRLLTRWMVPLWASDGKRYLHGPGAILLVAGLSRSPALQRPLLTPTVQYLGTISYSLYIVHGPILHSFGYVFGPAVLARTGTETGSTWAFGVALAVAAPLALTLVVAHFFYQFVDVSSVRVATAFQKLCTLE